MARGFSAITTSIALSIALMFVVHVPVAYAQHGNSGAARPAQSTQHDAPPAQAHGQPARGTSPQGTMTTSRGSTVHTSEKSAAHKSATVSGTTKTTTKTTVTAPSGTVPLTPVQQKLTANTKLAAKVQSRLPPGTNLMTAADGFRNLGQFVAAINVSRNLGIPFTQLKNDLVVRRLSLGQSIQDLRPNSNATVEAERAESDARRLVIEVETTRTTATAPRPRKRISGGRE